MKKRSFYSMLLLIVLSAAAFSQEKRITDSVVVSTSEKEQSYLLTGAGFNNDIVFLGRKSPTKSPYLSLSAGYYHQSGLYITGIVSYLVSSQQNRIDLFTASGGYDYTKKSFTAGVSATGYVFNNKSYAVKSALTANISAYADYDFDLLELYADGAMYFSSQTDFIFSVAVSHNFYAAHNKLIISPAFSLYGGTQNYYSNYNNNIKFGKHMNNTGGAGSMGTGMMGNGIFNVQNYEFSVPVKYKVKRFQFIFIPVYAIPVNAATITGNQNTYKEDLSNTFFWSIGTYYKFSKQKKQIL
ncbi:MAG: hypothetical protein K2X48_18625 [Chitinophagaceae bacterium]|nr:hypothetical protein [Chitinophagaceae bacterium]